MNDYAIQKIRNRIYWKIKVRRIVKTICVDAIVVGAVVLALYFGGVRLP